ncbi:MAG: hypothetical protein WBC21_01495 [Minisyncoccales bacterium]
MVEEQNYQKVSNWWYIVVILMGIIGGLIAWLVNRDANPKQAKKFLFVGIIVTLIPLIIYIIFIPSKIKEAKITASDAMITVYMNELRTKVMLFEDENSSYIGLENYSDTIRIKNDIIMNGGTSFAVNSTDTKYCAEVQMTSGKWYCIDSDWVRREQYSNPACSANHYTCD